jgi:GNAT superfamily N-acetyltransferase
MVSFKVYYESSQSDKTELDLLVKDAEAKGIDIFIYYKNKMAALDHIRVPENTSGLGSWFMNELINWADKHKVLIHLSAARKGDLKSKDKKYKVPSSNRRLIDFYKRFGFIENKGRNKRFDFSDTMYREPR